VNPPPPDPTRQEELSGIGAHLSKPASRTPQPTTRKSQPPMAGKSNTVGARKSQPPAGRKSVPPAASLQPGPLTTRPPRVATMGATRAPAAHAPKKPSRVPLPGVRPSQSPTGPAAPMAAGRIVGRYKLLVPIGAGGMAQVWAARPETAGLARTVAIKLVLPDYAADSEYERMFVDEAMVASAIRHPNVCETLELGRDGDLIFMVLEWIAGESLSGLLQQSGTLQPVPDPIAARIVAEGCAGLHAAHEALGADGEPLGIVHRDVSPPNILISTTGHVKVSDFGIAKARYQLHSKTRTGEIKGKFAYIPPEQILGRGVDRRADVYAMGCVLYIATLGLRPFGGGASALGKIVQGKYLRPSEIRSNYPPGLEAIVLRALASDPAQRFQTADELRVALEQWLMAESEIVMESDVANVVRQRISKERRMVIDAVMSSGRALPEALAAQLLSRNDRTQTPTANSRVFIAAPRPRVRLSSRAPAAAPAVGPAVEDVDLESSPTWRPPKKGPGEHTDPGGYEAPPHLPMDFHPDEGESTVRNKQQVFASSRPPAKNGSNS
jgi:serine/threonine protein kinase